MRQQQYSVHTRQEAGRRLANLAEASPRIDVRLLMDELHASGTDSSGYGQVAHLLAGQPADLRTLWVAPASPLTAAFIPWRIGVDSVPPEYRRHRYLTAGEAERQLIDPRQQGLESTRYVNRAVARLYYLVNEHRDQFLPEVERALRHFENALLAEHETVTRSARLLLEAGEPGLARRFLTRTVHAAAGEGHRLVEDLATGIEARTRYEHGFRMPDE